MDTESLLTLLDSASERWATAAGEPFNTDPSDAAGQAAVYARFATLALRRVADRDPALAAEIADTWERIPGAGATNRSTT